MSWATGYIAKLVEGERVEFRPRGNSMKPQIKSGDLVIVDPVLEETELAVGDIVLCKVRGKQYLHKILKKRRLPDITTTWGPVEVWDYQIGNNRGHVNGWITRYSIYGKLVENKRKD